MDDGLVHFMRKYHAKAVIAVLILVIMDDGLVPIDLIGILLDITVLILVVMDDGLVRQNSNAIVSF